MVFKRRDKRSVGRIVLDSLYPRGGWRRAVYYIRHRLQRLPDTPHKIARGIFAGIFVTFTPLFGLHFFIAALLAWMLRGNIVAALLATLVGNPLTFVPIAMVSLQTGHFLLGSRFDNSVESTLVGKFQGAAGDLADNLVALFTAAPVDWTRLSTFYHEVFLPYLVGGIGPGIAAGLAGYYLALPVITAYQNSRRARRAQKLARLREAPPRDRS